jgi:uncharacterized membrane protein YjjB (DUF3815 family)
MYVYFSDFLCIRDFTHLTISFVSRKLFILLQSEKRRQEMIIEIFKDILFSFCVAVGFGLLFETPKKAVLAAGVLGGVGHCVRMVLVTHLGLGLVSATLVACLFIGLSGLFTAHKIHTPPVVFTLPACITMIPGLYAYRTVLGLIHIYESGKAGSDEAMQYIASTCYNFILTFMLLFCLAIGICVAMLLFRKKSAKEIRFDSKRIIRFGRK